MDFNRWCSANDEAIQQLPFSVAEWLAEFGSLTEKLRQYSNPVKLQIIQECTAKVQPDESEILKIKDNEEGQIREVVLFGPEKPWIFARTVMPLSTGHLIKTLGNQPLGSILFSDQELRRQFLQVRQLSAQHRLYRSAQQYLEQDVKYLWARRSLWASNNNDKRLAMMVCEVFLPDSPLY